MNTDVFIGHHCPKCKTTIATYTQVGGEANCPGCGGRLVSEENEKNTTVIANAHCKKCGFSAGLFSSVGGDGSCPKCGGEIEGQ